MAFLTGVRYLCSPLHRVMRKHEADHFSGMAYYMLGVTVTCALFHETLSVIGKCPDDATIEPTKHLPCFWHRVFLEKITKSPHRHAPAGCQSNHPSTRLSPLSRLHESMTLRASASQPETIPWLTFAMSLPRSLS